MGLFKSQLARIMWGGSMENQHHGKESLGDRSDLSDLCDCPCHSNSRIMHFIPCCFLCSFCGQRVRLETAERHTQEIARQHAARETEPAYCDERQGLRVVTKIDTPPITVND